MYPAAYSYVIGVMAYTPEGKLADFSNWDYKMNYGAEYEIVAPGYGLVSTLPGNRYASWSGTSMAAPTVSAAAAVLRSCYSDKSVYSSRYIMGQIVGASTEVIPYVSFYGKVYNYKKLCLKDSLLKKPKPHICVNEVYVFDSPEYSSANNGDGIIQPGETIALAVGLRNQWGAATNVRITCNSSPNGVPSQYAEYINGNEFPINDIGTFGTQDNGFIYDDEGIIIGVDTPLLVKISENTPNDVHIPFYINYLAENALDDSDTNVYTMEKDAEFSVNVQSGKVIRGKITSDMNLTPDSYYIIDNSLLIPRGVTVNVEPGTKIQFWSGDSAGVYSAPNIAFVEVEGTLNFNGTQEAPIELFPGKNYEEFRVEVIKSGNGIVNMDYVKIINPQLNITRGSHLDLQQNYDSLYYRYYSDSQVYTSGSWSEIRSSKGISNSIFTDLRFNYLYGKYDTVLFNGCGSRFEGIEATNCTFLVNQSTYEDYYAGTLLHYTASMNGVGQSFRNPSYEPISSIYTLNGKKYVAYQFDNFFYDDYIYESGNNYPTYYWKENFTAVREAFEKNNGTMLQIDLSDNPDSDELDMLYKIYSDILKNTDMAENQTVFLSTDYYYESNSTGNVTSTGRKLTNRIGATTSPYLWYGFYTYRTTEYDENGETNEVPVKTYYTSNADGFYSHWYSGSYYVVAEYDESVSDYKVLNPVFDIGSSSVVKNTKFTNNAILNRISSKNTSDWMKLNAGSDRNRSYLVTNNYWGTTDPEIIQKQLVDFDTNIMFGDYITSPELSAPAETTYPCVAELYLTDKNGEVVKNVSSGEYDVHVVFNRDMDTSVAPMVTYGPDDPYTDYTVNGSWVSAREWSGKATVKVLINQGVQYFRVKNAAAASDPWLVTGTDWGRFTFNIQASGTEALTLQGNGEKGAVFLNWVQDDYDTMAGYNIYRSESGEEGPFSKINTSIIAPDTKEYYDKKVVAGIKYNYYFTVVDTDFKHHNRSSSR